MPDPDSPITQLLDAARQGDAGASEALLPLVYEELRRLARARMAGEAPQTLQPTALVHEAYLRLVGDEVEWDSRGHFFAAAAEAMRRILIERARQRRAAKHGGELRRTDLDSAMGAEEPPAEELLALDEALAGLEAVDERLAQVVKLRYFAGMTLEEVGAMLDLTPRTVGRDWAAAKAWLYRRMARDSQ